MPKLSEQNVTYIQYGNRFLADDFHIGCVFCDHGIGALDAVGLVLAVDEKGFISRGILTYGWIKLMNCGKEGRLTL